jgi:tetratricopeptide (TPR) repeat protein
MRHVVALALIAACGGTARWPASDLEPSPPADPAKVQASVAAASNESGIEAMRAGKFMQATVHFRDAAARNPEPPYLFNICLSLYQEGKLGEARMGCRGALSQGSPRLAEKARKMIERIESEAQAKGVELFDGGGSRPDDGADPDQATIAAALSADGAQLMHAKKYAEASAKFREAVARVPEPKYFFNLCASLFQEGKFGEALAACDGVAKNSPSPELAAKTAALNDRIVAEAKAQGISMTGGDPVEPDAAPVSATGGQAAIAAKLSDEGVKLVYAKKYAEASAKFRDAVARVPEPKYFFNLCTSLFQEGKFSDALTSCAAGKRNNPPAALATKLDAMIKRIRDEARAQNIPLEIH